ncbi:MAG TPA: TIGR01777 family oxidoreductase [Solirubrobacteraceae bacterium]|nr:TIGR01777 family oxidoreductase [Solirubrobacteraceae bacterium]
MKVVIAGGAGLLGRRIAARLLQRGDEVVVLSRSPAAGLPGRQVAWDGRTVGPWADELRGAALINLAGAFVDRPPTAANIDLLRRSRVEPTQALVAAAADLDTPPRVWLQASTLAIYGDTAERILDETEPPADGPAQMAGVARPWEQAAAQAPTGRLVVMRSGIVLDRDSPVFRRLVTLVRCGLGGRIGSGRQWVSWIHIADFLSVIELLLGDDGVDGVVHVTGPNPARNAELMRGLRHVLHRPPAPPTPAPLLRLGAAMLRSDPALALTGRRCVPRRLLDDGFAFAYPELIPALRSLARRSAI